jgi:ribose/xylose/arabinose/galactoside ABC-type transport system permease subunit
VLEYTTLGTQIRAIGGNREAASATGVNTQRLSTILYVLCGLFAALAGVLQASYLGAGDPTLGASLNLQAIAAAIIGGVSMYGSIGTVIGIVLGSVLLSVLTTGLILMRINPGMQDFVVGVVLIMAAGADRMRRQRMIRVSRARQIEIDEGAAT